LECTAEDRWLLQGELDVDGARLLSTLVDTLGPGVDRLFLDCSELEFVDVAGWRALRKLRADLLPDTELVLTEASDRLGRVTDLLGPP
jgi:anti-anti-sigma regulatory factor